jgi:uncharacterized membrane protein
MVPGALIRTPLVDYIHKSNPDWDASQMICRECLNRYRSNYVLDILKEESGELSTLNADVARSLTENELMTHNVDQMFDRQLTLGERVADRVASFGGSWRFIGIFAATLILWMIVNAVLLARPFDPYPFILLNLVLSCLAAIQAPVIMMSQNRQEEKDRMRGEYDYRVNLKAELEIRHLHEKIDLLLNHQWEKLMEIQAIQMEMMSDIMEKRKGKS